MTLQDDRADRYGMTAGWAVTWDMATFADAKAWRRRRFRPPLFRTPRAAGDYARSLVLADDRHKAKVFWVAAS